MNPLDNDVMFIFELQTVNYEPYFDFLDSKIENLENVVNISWKLKDINTGIYIRKLWTVLNLISWPLCSPFSIVLNVSKYLAKSN